MGNTQPSHSKDMYIYSRNVHKPTEYMHNMHQKSATKVHSVAPDSQDINYMNHFHSRKCSHVRAADFREDQNKIHQSSKTHNEIDGSHIKLIGGDGGIFHPHHLQKSAKAAQCYCAGRENN